MTNKKKILFLHAGAEMYGADKILLEIVTGIDKNEFTPVVILPNHGVLEDALQNFGIDVDVLNYPILRRKFFTPFGLVNYVYNYFKYGHQLSRIVSKKQIDLVHVNTAAVLEGIYLKIFAKVPILWHIHEIILNPEIVYKITSYLIGKYADKIITVSKATEDRLLESSSISSNKVETIFNGIESEQVTNGSKTLLRNELNISKDAIVVGMVGRINAWKGQAEFIDAVSKVITANPNVHAILVGGVFEGEEWRIKTIDELIRNSNNSTKIHRIDFRKNIKDVYAAFDIFVMPSVRPDPFPTVVLEAMANGLPVVGFNHGGVVEMLDKTSFIETLVDIGNTDKLADQIINLVKNKEKRIVIGNNLKDRQVAMFSEKMFLKRFQVEYRKCIGSDVIDK